MSPQDHLEKVFKENPSLFTGTPLLAKEPIINAMESYACQRAIEFTKKCDSMSVPIRLLEDDELQTLYYQLPKSPKP